MSTQWHVAGEERLTCFGSVCRIGREENEIRLLEAWDNENLKASHKIKHTNAIKLVTLLKILYPGSILNLIECENYVAAVCALRLYSI